MTIRLLLLAFVFVASALPATAQDRIERILAGKVLRVGNSVYYNPSQESIRTISRAIVLIGFDYPVGTYTLGSMVVIVPILSC